MLKQSGVYSYIDDQQRVVLFGTEDADRISGCQTGYRRLGAGPNDWIFYPVGLDKDVDLSSLSGFKNLYARFKNIHGANIDAYEKYLRNGIVYVGGMGDDILLAPGPGRHATLAGGRGNDILVVADREAGLQSLPLSYIGGQWKQQELRGGSGDDDLFGERILGVERTFVYGRGCGDDIIFVVGGYGG